MPSDEALPGTTLRRRLIRWLMHPSELRSIAIAIALGAAIEFIVIPFLFEDSRIVRGTADAIADSMMQIGEATGITVAGSRPFALVDIDQPTWEAWTAPLLAPRDKLATMLAHLAKAGAATIVVDIDLAWPGLGWQPNKPLLDFLALYGEDGPAPPIILVRHLDGADSGRHQFVEPRRTDFDDVVRSNRHLHWASPLFDVDGRDYVIRRWRLWEVICDKGTPAVLPSVELLAAAIVSDPPAGAGGLSRALARHAPEACDGGADAAADESEYPLENTTVALARDELARRIVYAIPWHRGEREAGARIEHGGERVPLVTIRPAAAVLAAAEAGEPLDWLGGRTVLIGATYADSSDFHRMPLGRMPGVFDVIYAIHSLLEHGTLVEPPVWVKIPLSLGMIIVVAILFHRLTLPFATAAAGLVIFALMLASLPWFHSGVLLDLAVPSVGVIAHRGIVTSSDFWGRWRRIGWRAILRAHDRE